jgi:hypothetical protein
MGQISKIGPAGGSSTSELRPEDPWSTEENLYLHGSWKGSDTPLMKGYDQGETGRVVVD